MMTFDKINGNDHLWAVKYDGDCSNILTILFKQWTDIDWLSDFFTNNYADLQAYFRITDVNKAIYDTVNDADCLSCLILDLSPDVDFDTIFRPLSNLDSESVLLSKEKAKGQLNGGHKSWLRIYALRLQEGIYLITGGAIKLTRTMQEREHTLKELTRMELVRNYLLENGVVDVDGFNELVSV